MDAASIHLVLLSFFLIIYYSLAQSIYYSLAQSTMPFLTFVFLGIMRHGYLWVVGNAVRMSTL